MLNLEAKVEYAAEAVLGEGPVWDAITQQLYWIDIKSKTVFRYDPVSAKQQSWELNQMVGCIAVKDGENIVCALQDRIINLNTITGAEQVLSPIEPDLPENRSNDGKADAEGRFWVGTLHIPGDSGKASLYRLNRDLSLAQMVKDLGMSNGLGWSRDNKMMYLIDTTEKSLLQFDFDLSAGTLTNKKVLLDLKDEEGSPDGMCVDEPGNIWIAFYGGKRVTCYNPSTGEKIAEVSVPAVNVTCCTFGGKELDILYITTARDGVSDEDLESYPDTGSLFSVKPGVKGRRTNEVFLNFPKALENKI